MRRADAEGLTGAASAFSTLANETRLAAIRALWQAPRPLRFSELVEAADVTDTANFTYHLEKLQPRFIVQNEERYGLTHAGRAAMTVVTTGDVLGRPAFDPTPVDRDCPFCGEPVIVDWSSDRLRVRCEGCPGAYRGSDPSNTDPANGGDGVVTNLDVAAGLAADRAPAAVLDDALERFFVDIMASVHDVCRDCGGRLDRSYRCCSAHDEGDGLCSECGLRYGLVAGFECRHCHRRDHLLPFALAAGSVRVLRFFAERGEDLFADVWQSYDLLVPASESIEARDPLRYTLRWTVGGDEIAMTLGEDVRPVTITTG